MITLVKGPVNTRLNNKFEQKKNTNFSSNDTINNEVAKDNKKNESENDSFSQSFNRSKLQVESFNVDHNTISNFESFGVETNKINTDNTATISTNFEFTSGVQNVINRNKEIDKLSTPLKRSLEDDKESPNSVHEELTSKKLKSSEITDFVGSASVKEATETNPAQDFPALFQAATSNDAVNQSTSNMLIESSDYEDYGDEDEKNNLVIEFDENLEETNSKEKIQEQKKDQETPASPPLINQQVNNESFSSISNTHLIEHDSPKEPTEEGC
jgi:hypothetical protein